jgi:hypothetical protein
MPVGVRGDSNRCSTARPRARSCSCAKFEVPQNEICGPVALLMGIPSNQGPDCRLRESRQRKRLPTAGRDDPNYGGLIIAKARGREVRPYLLRTIGCGVFFHRRRRRCGLITRKSGSQSGRCDDYEQREGRQDFHLLRLGCVQVKTAHPVCRSQGRTNKGGLAGFNQRLSSRLGREFLEAWLITERHAGGWFPFGGLCCVEAGFPGREKSR